MIINAFRSKGFKRGSNRKKSEAGWIKVKDFKGLIVSNVSGPPFPLTQKGNFFILPARRTNHPEEHRPSFPHAGRIRRIQ
jgi:hypothetical protein